MLRTGNIMGLGTLLPPAAVDFLRRRAIEGAGLFLLALAGAVAAALLSFDAADPSINTARDGAVANLMGRPGAVVADLLLQAVGAAGALPALVLGVWGARMIGKRVIGHLWARALLAVVGMVLFAVGLAALPIPETWPLRSGLGGVAGTLMLGRIDAALMGVPALADMGWLILAAAFTIGTGGLGAVVFALGLTSDDWRAVGRSASHVSPVKGRGSAPALGAALGAALVRLGRFLGRMLARSEPVRRADGPTLGDERPSEARPRRVAPKPAPPKEGRKAKAERQKSLDLGIDEEGGYRPPPLELLAMPPRDARAKGGVPTEEALEQNARLLESVLKDFGVQGEVVKVRPGPVVTLYELSPAPGTKTSRVVGLADDIARSMAAVSVRVAVIPGRNVIGIELPNRSREMVFLRELLESEAFERAGAKLALALGKDIGGAPVTVDLASMPHLLIAGTTGSGKSVAVNTMILSLLYRLTPEQVRFIMVDPKMLELSVYDGIPHLLSPVVTEPGKAVVALKWAVREMEDRYRLMAQLGVRNISGYNGRIAEARGKGELLTRRVQTGFDEAGKPIIEDQPLSMEPLPFIVVVVDEMADLMLVAGKDVEAAIQRLAQMARAAGIHLIMATQRPSVDVITGTIKANFPTRVSFQVTSKIDSRTILGEQGAEQLLGQGDMLYMAGGGRISRVHGPFVGDDEVEEVVAFLRAQGEPEYLTAVTEDEGESMIPGLSGGGGGNAEDQLYDEAVALVAREGKASTSFVQRHLQIGYNRAARLIERMEQEGVVGKANRVGKREVLVGHHGD